MNTRVVLALISLAGIVVGSIAGNIDRIATAWVIWSVGLEPVSAQVTGQWLGVFRESVSNTKQERITAESVTLQQLGNTKDVEGSANTAQRLLRKWNLRGHFENEVLVVSYFGGREAGAGGVAFVLKGKPEMGILRGYWTGYDPEKGMLMSCPYILTKEKNEEQVKAQNAVWLQRPCLHE